MPRDASDAGSRFVLFSRRVPPSDAGQRDDHLRTAPALLAGLERLLAIDDLMGTEDLAEILALACRHLPRLFPERPE